MKIIHFLFITAIIHPLKQGAFSKSFPFYSLRPKQKILFPSYRLMRCQLLQILVLKFPSYRLMKCSVTSDLVLNYPQLKQGAFENHSLFIHYGQSKKIYFHNMPDEIFSCLRARFKLPPALAGGYGFQKYLALAITSGHLIFFLNLFSLLYQMTS